MNVPLSLLLVAEIFSVFSRVDALPGWWWGSSSKHKYWNRPSSERDHICSVGQCVQAWKCPKIAVSSHSSDRCAKWNNGPMVCCVLNNDTNLHPGQSDVKISKYSTTSAYSKATLEQGHRTTPQSNENINETLISTNSTHDHWNTKSCDRPKSVGSFGDILKNSREKGLGSPSSKNNTSNTFRNVRTSIAWDKPRTSDIRVVFPTESVWLSKRTSHPAFTTDTFKNIYNNKITKSWITRSTTPSVITLSYFTKNMKKTTSDSTFTTKKFNQTSNINSTKSWVTRSTTTMTPRTTKHSKRHISNPEFTAERTTHNKSTKLWSTRSTTVAPVGYTTGTTRRAVFKPTSFSFSGKSTDFGKATTRAMFTSTKPDHDRRQDWGKSTPTNPRVQTPKPKSTNPPFITRSTRSSTRGYRITTTLPNVNAYSCGIRDERTGSNRERRNYDGKYPAASNISSGGKSIRGRQPYQRIVGGEEVEPFSWPWVAALYKVTSPGGNRFLCAGSLINENFVLTAAHVFTPDDLRTASYFVMLGTHNAQDAVAQYLISSILRHPEYENRYYYHDIALLRLERPVSFNHYVMPVCLPSPDAPLFRDRDLQGKNVTVMGWGDEAFGGKSSRVLKEATFPVVPRASCNISYLRVASNRFPRGITDDMLCAGDPNGGKDACQGDSGGPLTSIELGRYTQVGIVSFGYQCGDKEFPGVYTKVAPYLGWIAENTLRNRDYEIGSYDYY